MNVTVKAPQVVGLGAFCDQWGFNLELEAPTELRTHWFATLTPRPWERARGMLTSVGAFAANPGEALHKLARSLSRITLTDQSQLQDIHTPELIIDEATAASVQQALNEAVS